MKVGVNDTNSYRYPLVILRTTHVNLEHIEISVLAKSPHLVFAIPLSAASTLICLLSETGQILMPKPPVYTFFSFVTNI
jgi:hypothetical protein